ncbi:MAG: FAD-dependent oxidoreductase, partial [Clostridia bacterium]|nr:FAD-dependent oxidoreductase [Clostridia bacterium]
GGIYFLEKLGLGEKPLLGKNVAVCGGGNTAMDCCRTAVRLGAENVYVVYRRTRNEMPAADIEIEEAEEEGVTFKFLTNPAEIYADENGHVAGMKLQIMELGEPDASGRRRPVPVEGAIEDIKVDNVLMAIGQVAKCDGVDGIELTKKGTIVADDMTFRTNIDNVFAAGDVTNRGAGIAIEAIGEAQKAALCINNYLAGDEVRYKKPYFVEDEKTEADFEDREKQQREKMPGLSPEERRDNFNPIYFGFTEEQAKNEASRCLDCGCHDYYDCRLIDYANRYDVEPEKFPGEVHARPIIKVADPISHNPDKCVLCGLCYRTCDQVVGQTFIGLYNRGFSTVVNPMVPADKAATFCATCLKCVEVCPTGAMKSEIPVVRRVER